MLRYGIAGNGHVLASDVSQGCVGDGIDPLRLQHRRHRVREQPNNRILRQTPAAVGVLKMTVNLRVATTLYFRISHHDKEIPQDRGSRGIRAREKQFADDFFRFL